MAENKKGFILYADLLHTVEYLTAEQSGLLFRHILEYVNDKKPETENVIINLAFEPIKQQLKRDLKHWESIRKKRSEAGIASARKRKKKQQVLTSVKCVEQNSTKSTVIVNDTVTDTVINIPTKRVFLLYAKEKDQDYEFKKVRIGLKYEAWVINGWKDGNNKPIKNWKLKLLNALGYMRKDYKPQEQKL